MISVRAAAKPDAPAVERLTPSQFHDTASILDQVGRSPVASTRRNVIAAWGELIRQAPPTEVERAVDGLLEAALNSESSRDTIAAAVDELAKLSPRAAASAVKKLNAQVSINRSVERAARAAQLLSAAVSRLNAEGKFEGRRAEQFALRGYLRLLRLNLSQMPLKMRRALMPALGTGLLTMVLIWALVQGFEMVADVKTDATSFLLSGAFGAALFATIAGAAVAVPMGWVYRRWEKLAEAGYLAVAMAVATLFIYLGTQVIVTLFGMLSLQLARTFTTVRYETVWWQFDIEVLLPVMLIVGLAVFAARLLTLAPLPIARLNVFRVLASAAAAGAVALLLSALLLPGTEARRWLEAAVIAAAAVSAAMAADGVQDATEAAGIAVEPLRPRWLILAGLLGLVSLALVAFPAYRLGKAANKPSPVDVQVHRDQPLARGCPEKETVPELHFGEYYPLVLCRNRDMTIKVHRAPEEASQLIRLVIAGDRFAPLQSFTNPPETGLRTDLLAERRIFVCVQRLLGREERPCARAPEIKDEDLFDAFPAALRSPSVPNLKESSEFFQLRSQDPSERDSERDEEDDGLDGSNGQPASRTYALVIGSQDRSVTRSQQEDQAQATARSR